MRRKILLTVMLALVAGTAPVAAASAADTKPLPAPTPGRAADDGYTARQASARVEAAATTIKGRIQAYVRTNGTAYTWAAFADVTTDRVQVQTDAPATVVTPIVGEYAALTSVRRAAVEDLWSRRDDISPFWGGNGIVANGGGCSSGYTVRTPGNTRFLVTAGHCWGDNVTVKTEIGAKKVGVTLGKTTTGMDSELLLGQSYQSAIFVGGVNSASGQSVEGAADPKAGFQSTCHSGRTTGEKCGHVVTSTLSLVCTKSGCKLPVTSFVFGTMPDHGDSGSPFYVYSSDGSGVHIRGHIIAGSDDGVFGYAELFSKVASKYAVTIAT
jgi:hypothetical protein